jgi:hypothetical protein
MTLPVELIANLKLIQDKEDELNAAPTKAQSRPLYKEYKKLITEKVTLPSFYTFPERPPLYTITVVEDENEPYRCVVTDEDGAVVEFDNPNSIESIYDSINSMKADMVFAGKASLIPGNEKNAPDEEDIFDGGMIWIPTENSSYVKALISSPHDDHVYLAKSDYLGFLNTTVAYEEDPTNFVIAFSWVNNHPAFWSRYKEDKDDWNTRNIGHVWTDVTVSPDTRKTVVMLEFGAAIPDARTSHYHDLRLDVYEETYEEAIIALAALVHKFFDIDGSERKNVEYEKSELEKTLDTRVAEMNETFGEETE